VALLRENPTEKGSEDSLLTVADLRDVLKLWQRAQARGRSLSGTTSTRAQTERESGHGRSTENLENTFHRKIRNRYGVRSL